MNLLWQIIEFLIAFLVIILLLTAIVSVFCSAPHRMHGEPCDDD